MSFDLLDFFLEPPNTHDGHRGSACSLKVTAGVSSFWLAISFWNVGDDSIAHANEVILLVLSLKV